MYSWDKINRRLDGQIELLYRHERLFEEGILSPGLRVLDIGGWGVLAMRMLEEGIDCIILDKFTEDQYYPDRVRSLPLVEGDILDSSVLCRLGKFDVVTCFEMLEHCEDQSLAVSNIYNLLHDEGIFAGTVPIPGFAHKEEDTVNFLSPQDLNMLLVKSGFLVDLIEPTGSVFKNDVAASIYFKCRKEK